MNGLGLSRTEGDAALRAHSEGLGDQTQEGTPEAEDGGLGERQQWWEAVRGWRWLEGSFFLMHSRIAETGRNWPICRDLNLSG